MLKPSAFNLIFVGFLALCVVGAAPVEAQQRTGFLGGLFGGGQQNRNQQAANRAANAAEQHANREVQTALNFFEFEAGIADGILGRRSRAAVSAFQTFLEYPDTGTLASEERAVLLSAYEQVANAEDELALKLSLNLVTIRELLKSVKLGEPLIAEPEPNLPLGPRSMRTLCVNIQASESLDLVMAQFCNLRQLAMDQGAFHLETALNAQMVAPVVEECQKLTTELQPQIEQVLTLESEQLFAELVGWVEDADVPAEKFVKQAETCLGLAYQHDDSEAALAALMVLSGMKDAVYIEMLGHHIAFGLGLNGVIDFERATAWLELALPNLTLEDVSLTSQSGVARAKVIVDVLNILAAQG